MSEWADICDAWLGELQATIPELSTAKTHRFAPWSLEQLFTLAGDRHLAVWPTSDAEDTEPLLATPSVNTIKHLMVLAWEDAGAEAARLQDDDEANEAWLSLHEAIRARFVESDNIRLGILAAMDTKYVGAAFPSVAGKRVLDVRFDVRVGYVST